MLHSIFSRGPRRSAVAAAALSTLCTLLCAPLSGCSDSLTTGANNGFSVLLTDAPGDVQNAVVTISEIYLQGGGANGRVTLMTTPVTTDLTTLANTTSQLVRNAVVPRGTYAQLRFVITGGYIAVANGNGGTDIYASSPTYPGLPPGAQVTGTLQMPSLPQSGLKVILPSDSISTTTGHTLVVDFDVSRSFGHQAGNSGRWVMHPVLKATELTQTGNITATLQTGAAVTLPIFNADTDTTTLGNFSAVLTMDSLVKTVAFSDSGHVGVYTASFQYLAPGVYALDVVPPDSIAAVVTMPAHPATVTLGSGADDTTAFTMTGISLLP